MSDVLTPFLPNNHKPDEEWQDFIKITSEEFYKRLNEPLWAMTDALLYLHGYKTNLHDDDKIRFLRFKPTVQKARTYILDAQKTKALELYDYRVESMTKPDTDDFEKQRDAPFYASKVKPKDFVEWAKTLPIEFPMLDTFEEKNPKPLSDKERSSLLKMIIGMAIEGYRYDPAAKRGPTASEIASDLQLLGISLDEDTIRRWLKEAVQELPSNWHKKS